MEYYTYAYLREDKSPYYIGKGKGDRAYKTRRKGINPPKNKSRIIKLKQNLIEKEAFRHEVYMISVFGRKDLGTGILHNKTDGGEGSSGSIRTNEQKNNLKHKNLGKTLSEETKRKISEARTGKLLSEETKRKMSKAKKNISEETRRKMSKAQKARRKISESQIKYDYKIYSIKESTIYKTNNLNAFCRDNMLDRRHLIKSLNKTRKQHKGFILLEKIEIQNKIL